MGPHGRVEVNRLAEILGVTIGGLAACSGLAWDPDRGAEHWRSSAAQARLQDVAGILNRIVPWTGSPRQALAWYRSQPLPSFGGRTSEDLVKEGQTDALKAFLSRIALGGYA